MEWRIKKNPILKSFQYSKIRIIKNFEKTIALKKSEHINECLDTFLETLPSKILQKRLCRIWKTPKIDTIAPLETEVTPVYLWSTLAQKRRSAAGDGCP